MFDKKITTLNQQTEFEDLHKKDRKKPASEKAVANKDGKAPENKKIVRHEIVIRIVIEGSNVQVRVESGQQGKALSMAGLLAEMFSESSAVFSDRVGSQFDTEQTDANGYSGDLQRD